MEHKEYLRISRGASTAVLFIHGIVGTPNHFTDFVSLVPQTVSVYNLLLDGHGKGAEDFSNTSMEKWEKQVSSAVIGLSALHERVYIVAHSLGTLLAIEQAIKNKKVCKLFLLAVPLCLSIKPKMPINSLKVYFDKISPDDREALAAKNCCGVSNDKNPLSYIGWVPRFTELFSKMRKTRDALCALNTPCQAYQSCKDEMVARKSERYLSQNPCITVKVLENSGHYYYDEADRELLIAEFTEMIKSA